MQKPSRERGLKLRRKTEHLVPASNRVKLKIRKQNGEEYVELPQTKSFKYLGTTIYQDGDAKEIWRK